MIVATSGAKPRQNTEHPIAAFVVQDSQLRQTKLAWPTWDRTQASQCYTSTEEETSTDAPPVFMPQPQAPAWTPPSQLWRGETRTDAPVCMPQLNPRLARFGEETSTEAPGCVQKTTLLCQGPSSAHYKLLKLGKEEKSIRSIRILTHACVYAPTRDN